MVPLPMLTRTQSAALYRLAQQHYGLDPLQTVELLGCNLALLASSMLERDLIDRPVVVLVGRGHKGAVGLAAARYLVNWGAWVQILLTHQETDFQGIAARQLHTIQAMEQPVAWAEEGWELPAADLVVDGLVGAGLQGQPAGAANDLIRLANSSRAPILSLELPSGLDADRGLPGEPTIQAAATLAPFLPLAGLLAPTAQATAGRLYVCDSGIPLQAAVQLGLQPLPALFAHGVILPLRVESGQVWAVTGEEL